MKELIVIFSSFLLTFLLIIFLLPYLRKYTLDLPIKRSSHSVPTPKAGGISFFISSLLFFYLKGDVNIFVCTPLGLTGILDDIFNIPKKTRFFLQFLTSILIIYTSTYYKNIFLLDSSFFILIIFLCVTFLCVSVINFSNFFDGLDGLLTSSMIPIFFTASITVSSNYLILVSCLSAFLIFNWSPAKLFMGDIGSTFLGTIYLIAIFNTENIYTSLGLYLISAPIQLDCIFCIIRRFYNSENIFAAHKSHLYQRLNQYGWSHSKISLVYSSAILVLSFGFLIFGLKSFIITIPFLILFGIYLEKNFALKF